MLLILLCLLNYSPGYTTGETTPTPSSQSPSPATMTSSQSSVGPCAACKAQRRKCAAECLFAPYFPPERMEKFVSVHRVFGASNVGKILQEVDPEERSATVESLVYEANLRLKDIVYGSVGLVYLLQQRLRHMQDAFAAASQYLSALPLPSPETLNLNLMNLQIQDNNNDPVSVSPYSADLPQNHQIRNQDNNNNPVSVSLYSDDLQQNRQIRIQDNNNNPVSASLYSDDIQQNRQIRNQDNNNNPVSVSRYSADLQQNHQIRIQDNNNPVSVSRHSDDLQQNQLENVPAGGGEADDFADFGDAYDYYFGGGDDDDHTQFL